MKSQTPTLEKFLEFPTEKIANIVKSSGSKVVVFPFNGTRRWFLLEHGRATYENPAQAYIDLTAKAYIETYKLLFDYGLDTVVAPVFGGEILNRGDEYMEQIGKGMSLLAEHPYFLSFYEEYGVAVYFYGDYQKQLSLTPYSFILDLFDDVTKQTAQNKKRRLFYGVFGTDAAEAVAERSVEFYKQHNRVPSRKELIDWYYGDNIEKADIFIGFEKFNVFDYPLLGWGEESLYFTVAPSLYMNERQLRNILYDFLYLRPVQDPDYFTMPPNDFEAMRHFYNINREVTFGVGEMRGGIWYPAQRIEK
jgi:tuberculosinol/isotuberculosinol synthase